MTKPPRRVTVMINGPLRVGKTRLAATFPRVRFISDATEGGYETIRNMAATDEGRAWFFEPDVVPQVIAVESGAEMTRAIEQTKLDVQRFPGQILTLVIDSLTFLADTHFAHMLKVEKANPQTRSGEADTRKLYGNLWTFLRSTMIKVHEIPINIVWIALEKDNEYGCGINIAGRAAEVLPAAVDYIFYQHAYRPDKDSPLVFETRTKRFGRHLAGSRDEGRVPDPLPQCSYIPFAEAGGFCPNPETFVKLPNGQLPPFKLSDEKSTTAGPVKAPAKSPAGDSPVIKK